MTKYAKLVRSMRRFYGYSQSHVASMLNVSRPTYIAIEQGKRELTVGEASKLATVFQISLRDIAHGSIKGKLTREYKQEIKRLTHKRT